MRFIFVRFNFHSDRSINHAFQTIFWSPGHLLNIKYLQKMDIVQRQHNFSENSAHHYRIAQENKKQLQNISTCLQAQTSYNQECFYRLLQVEETIIMSISISMHIHARYIVPLLRKSVNSQTQEGTQFKQFA